MLDSRGDLSIAEIAFFGPVFFVSIYLLIRHGVSPRTGWMYITILSVLRLIGCACILYMEVNVDFTTSLLTAAAVTSTIGAGPILFTIAGFLNRINKGMERHAIPYWLFNPLMLLILTALGLAIAGGVIEFGNFGPGHFAPDKTGQKLLEAATVLFVVLWLCVSLLACFFTSYIRWTLPVERNLVRAAMLSVPFMLVRMAYGVCVAFAGPGSDFYIISLNVWAQSFMQFAMEAIIVCIYIVAGLLTPRIARREFVDAESGSPGGANASKEGARNGRARGLRTILDFRPSAMIIRFIQNR